MTFRHLRISKHTLRYVVGGLLLLLVSNTACSGGPGAFLPPEPNLPTAPAYTLLIDTESFPEGWQVEPCEPPACEDEIGFGDSDRDFIVDDPNVYNSVWLHVRRHRNIKAAAHEYQRTRETSFHERPPPQTPSTDFEPPAEISYQSLYADEYYFACGVDISPLPRDAQRAWLYPPGTDGSPTYAASGGATPLSRM